MVPVADQNYEIWNCPNFCSMIIRGKSKLWINTRYSLLKINLHEQQACTLVKFSDIAKNWPFVTLIPVDPPLDPKTFDIRRIILKNWIRGLGVYENEKIAQHI